MVIRTLGCLAALLLATTPVWAEPSSNEIANARRLFTEARAAEDLRDWAGATAKLRGAISVKETAGLRFHLAYCEEQQGMLVEALADYERSEDLGKQGNEDFVAQLPARRESLHKRIPTVLILLPPTVSDVVISVDGHLVPSAFLGKPMALNPGQHKLAASSPGRVGFTTDVTLKEGDALVTSASMPPADDRKTVSSLPSAAAKPDSPQRPSPPSPASFTGAGSAPGSGRPYALVAEATVALGALAVGIGYTVGATSADNRADNARARVPAQGCSPGADSAACTELQHFVDLAQTDRFIALLGFIGAGVSTAAFAGTLVLWPGSSVKASIVPHGTPTAPGLALVGRF
jgi:hypothetical protein